MTDVFQEVLTDAKGVEEKLLGPDYPYYKNIKTPKEIGMSSNGSLPALGKNIDGLIQYVELLVSGNSRASATGKPLGNKFFLQTGAKCVDTKTKEQQDRYIYVNNVPVGDVPFISSGMGVNFSDFKGIIPGMMGNLNALNPFAIMQAFMSGTTPDCQKITMQTIDVNNNKSTETHFVTLVDIQNMDPCIFPNKANPITKEKCREAFTTSANISPKLPDDAIDQIYFASLAGVVIYILYKLMLKN
jgi:hypothetical protein